MAIVVGIDAPGASPVLTATLKQLLERYEADSGPIVCGNGADHAGHLLADRGDGLRCWDGTYRLLRRPLPGASKR